MSDPINPAFQAALQRLGRPTTPAELEKRGVKRVLSIRSSQIALLIERAVNRTLMERTIGPLDEETRSEVLSEAARHFSRQLEDLEDLAESKSRLESHRREVQQGIAHLRSVCEEPAGIGATSRDPLLAAALEEQRRQFEAALDIQERRVDKLLDYLERTEQVLARVAASKGLEHGIESMYDAVQGLAPDAEHRELKRQMLARIFELNEADGTPAQPIKGALTSK